jgi:hypothetical protein
LALELDTGGVRMKRTGRLLAGIGVVLAMVAGIGSPALAAGPAGPAGPGVHRARLLAVVPMDWTSPGTPVGNDNPPIAYVDVYLDDYGNVYGELFSYRGQIGGSVVRLEASGYADFRNVPYSYPATVPQGADGVAAGGVPYNIHGAGWWWRTCGWVGSRSACTRGYSFG